MDLKVSGKKMAKAVFSPCITECFQGVEIAGGKSYECIVGLSLPVKFIIWGDSPSLWTVPYFNSGRSEVC